MNFILLLYYLGRAIRTVWWARLTAGPAGRLDGGPLAAPVVLRNETMTVGTNGSLWLALSPLGPLGALALTIVRADAALA